MDPVWCLTKMQVTCLIGLKTNEPFREALKIHLHDSSKMYLAVKIAVKITEEILFLKNDSFSKVIAAKFTLQMLIDLLKSRDRFKTVICNCSSFYI